MSQNHDILGTGRSEERIGFTMICIFIFVFCVRVQNVDQKKSSDL